MTRTHAALMAAFLIASSLSYAGTGNKDGAAHAPAAWASMDANSDGVLTREEVANTLWAQKFDQMDANGDGKVTKKEFAHYEHRMKHRQEKANDS